MTCSDKFLIQMHSNFTYQKLQSQANALCVPRWQVRGGLFWVNSHKPRPQWLMAGLGCLPYIRLLNTVMEWQKHRQTMLEGRVRIDRYSRDVLRKFEMRTGRIIVDDGRPSNEKESLAC